MIISYVCRSYGFYYFCFFLLTGCSSGGGKISDPDPVPDLDCPTGSVRLAGASKKTIDTCMLNTDTDTDIDGIPDSTDVDDDGDGLIEIDSLEKLHNIRYNLIGTSYKTSDDDVGDKTGCGGVGGVIICNGYELTQDLSFDKNGDGITWSGNSMDGYTLDVDDSISPYFIVVEGGWEPIGEGTLDHNDDLICNNGTCFNAIFEGNGHIITGLAILKKKHSVGMFGVIGADANIRSIGLVDNLANCTRTSDDNYVGGLVGWNYGSITDSYATGNAIGGASLDYVGGLVGYQDSGSITKSYATGNASGGASSDSVGGLVGYQDSGSITSSYAIGAVNGEDGNDEVGGLVGWNDGSITASYATGAVDGGGNAGGLVGQQAGGSITWCYARGAVSGGIEDDSVGGLVGQSYGSITGSYATGAVNGGGNVGGLVGQSYGEIIMSYATGNADGGALGDNVGGLVGWNYGSITSSYATGSADGGALEDNVGGLVGYQFGKSIIRCYAIGTVNGGDGNDDDSVGVLVGDSDSDSIGEIIVSYGFGTVN